jgi:porin
LALLNISRSVADVCEVKNLIFFSTALACSATALHAQSVDHAEPAGFEPLPGLVFGASYTADLAAGLRSPNVGDGAAAGVLEITLDLDLGKIASLDGFSFHASGLWLHGTNPADRLTQGPFAATSSIAGERALRLFELWLGYQTDNWSSRAGLLALDEYFAGSDTAGLFTNGAPGWPTALSANLRNGGPAYPLTSPGILLETPLTETFVLRNAIIAGSRFDETDNHNGLRHRFDSTAAFITAHELHHTSSAINGLQWKLGVLFDGGRPILPDGTNGRRDNIMPYGVVDWALGDLSIFARITGARADRSTVSSSTEIGAVLTNWIPSRPADATGIALAASRFSSAQRAAVIAGGDSAARSEITVELTHRMPITRNLTVQPTLQHVWDAAGVSGANGAVALFRIELSL